MNWSEAIISFFISIAASAAFYAYIENIKNSKRVDNSKKDYSIKHIKNIKKQFYICFIPISFIILHNLYADVKTVSSFFNVFKLVISFWLLLFLLFAFMCSIEVINNFTNTISKDSSQDRNNNFDS